MNAENILLLGLKNSVTAFSKADGSIVWRTEFKGAVTVDSFVTLLSDGQRVFAHAKGKLYCLDLANGRILWSDGLTGYGYGVASLCFPGGDSAPDSAAVQNRICEQRSSSS